MACEAAGQVSAPAASVAGAARAAARPGCTPAPTSSWKLLCVCLASLASGSSSASCTSDSFNAISFEAAAPDAAALRNCKVLCSLHSATCQPLFTRCWQATLSPLSLAAGPCTPAPPPHPSQQPESTQHAREQYSSLLHSWPHTCSGSVGVAREGSSWGASSRRRAPVARKGSAASSGSSVRLSSALAASRPAPEQLVSLSQQACP